MQRHLLRVARDGRRRSDADAHVTTYEPAYRIETAKLDAKFQATTLRIRFVGEKALQGAGPIESDEVVVEHFIERDMRRSGQRMRRGDHDDEAILAKRK